MVMINVHPYALTGAPRILPTKAAWAMVVQQRGHNSCTLQQSGPFFYWPTLYTDSGFVQYLLKFEEFIRIWRKLILLVTACFA